MGSPTATLEGAYDIFRTPLYDWEGWQNLIVSTQPVNPLYIGPYAVGPYDTNPVTPSGSTTTQTYYVSSSYGQARVNLNVTDAASVCQAQNGTESTPASVPAQGWWTGNLCAYGRTDWSTLPIKANRSLTLELTAQDEYGLVSSAKSLPVIGLWNAADATGTLPTIAFTPAAFNSSVTGMTTLTTQTSQPRQLRFAVMDQRSDGRPTSPTRRASSTPTPSAPPPFPPREPPSPSPEWVLGYHAHLRPRRRDYPDRPRIPGSTRDHPHRRRHRHRGLPRLRSPETPLKPSPPRPSIPFTHHINSANESSRRARTQVKRSQRTCLQATPYASAS